MRKCPFKGISSFLLKKKEIILRNSFAFQKDYFIIVTSFVLLNIIVAGNFTLQLFFTAKYIVFLL